MTFNILLSSPNNHDATVYLPAIHGVLKNYYNTYGKYNDRFKWLIPIYRKEYTIPEEQIDVLGISCYAWNSDINYELAKTVKEKNPNCIVVAGGPDVDHKNPNFFDLHPYVDVIAIQDGEITFMQLLDKIANDDRNFNNILGVLTKTNKLPSLPIKPTKFTGAVVGSSQSDFLHLCETIRIANKDTKLAYTIETDRGCPYGCTFCDWGSNTMNKIRTLELDLVFEEIEWVGKNQINALFIANANFGIFPRDVEIAKKLAEVKTKYGYPKIIQTNYTKTHSKNIVEIIKIFKEVDLIENFTLSIQTTSENTLKVSDRTNLSAVEIKKIIDLCDQLSLPIRPQLIIGMPGETLQSFKKSFEDLMLLGVYENYCIFPYELLVNAPANDKKYVLEHGLVSKKLLSRTYHSKKGSVRKNLSNYLIQTNTYSKDDYVEMIFFTAMVMSFVCMGFARLPLIYLSKEYSHTEILDKLALHFLEKKDSTIIGNILSQVKESFNVLAKDDENIYPDFEHPLIDFCLDADEFIMASMYEQGIENCFDELNSFFTKIDDTDKFKDLLKYQQSLIITPNYDPTIMKQETFKYDWSMWEKNTTQDPNIQETKIEYNDQIIGSVFKKDIVWHKNSNKIRAFLYQTLVAPAWRCNILLHKKINKYYIN